MSETQPIRTDFLVLRKTPYADTSLVVAGIAPEPGQLHFLVRGARRVGRRQFPVVDLFRVLQIQYREGRGELYTWQSADVVADFAGVAADVVAFQTAGWLARFALANVLPGVAQPRFFRALVVALDRLLKAAGQPGQAAARRHAITAGACAVYLDESGLLAPDPAGLPPGPAAAELLRFGAGDVNLASLPPADWTSLHRWLLQNLQLHHCTVPPGM